MSVRAAKTCELCDGSGWILDASGVARRCVCLERRAARARTHNLAAIVPPHYADLRLDGAWVDKLEPTAVDAVRRFIDQIDANLAAGKGLWLHGPPGTAQTALAMAASGAAIRTGASVAIYSLPRLLGAMRSAFAQEGAAVPVDLVDRLAELDLVQLDDLGAARRTDWGTEQLFALVNERLQRRRALIVTADCSAEELAEGLGWRTVVRLEQICGAPIWVGGCQSAANAGMLAPAQLASGSSST